jgi:hypothetical protein
VTLAVAYRQVVVIREHQAAVATSEMLAVALAQEELLLFAVISSIPQLVSWKDGDQRYAGSDQAFADFRGLDAAAIVIGRSEQGWSRTWWTPAGPPWTAAPPLPTRTVGSAPFWSASCLSPIAMAASTGRALRTLAPSTARPG